MVQTSPVTGRRAACSAPVDVPILDCGRSGTSIFGELFEHLPGYAYRAEPPFTTLLDTSYDTAQAFKVPKESAVRDS